MASEYFPLVDKITTKLSSAGVVNYLIPAYRTKESFGDMDILVEQKTNLVDIIHELFQPNELIVNGTVISFDVQELQIDLIKSHPDNIQFSLGYFGYNDFGNLVGRLAHKLGLKFGHNHLSYVVRNNHNVLGEIIITKDFNEALTILDLDATRQNEGFDTLEDIFNYVITSKYFSPEIYLLHNRNAVSRIRDKKRKTYQEFLKFCETLPVNEHIIVDKDDYLRETLMKDYSFLNQYNSIMSVENKRLETSKKFNGEIASQLTGLSGKTLGQFMSSFKRKHDLESLSPDEIRTLIPKHQLTWSDYLL